MGLQTSGAISLNDIHFEAGGGNATQASINDSDIRGLIGKGSGSQSSLSEYYGASSSFLSFPTDSAVFSEYRNNFNSTYGFASGLDSDWYWSGYARFSSSEKISHLGNILVPSGTYTISYDISFTSGSYGGDVYLTFAKFRSSPKTGHNQNTETVTDEELIIRHGTYPYGFKSNNVNGTMVEWNYNTSGTGRRQGTFTHSMSGSGDYQIGLKTATYASGSSNYEQTTINVHDFTVS